jgi:transposase
MMTILSPDDVITLKVMLRAEPQLAYPRGQRPGADAADREAQAHDQKAKARMLDQLELQLADLEENAARAETAEQLAAAETIAVLPSDWRQH